MSEVLKALFSREIQSNLFPNNEFYRNARRDGGIGIDAKTVEIPNAGGTPSVIKNPTSFPLATTVREDDKQTYTVNLYASTPTALQDENQLTVSYDKRADILSDHSSTLNQNVADDIAYAWASGVTAASVFQTTGTTTRVGKSGNGTRKKAIAADIQKIAERFDIDNVPAGDRFAVLPAELYHDLASLDDFIGYNSTGKVDMIAKGILGEIYGFMIMKRSYVSLWDITSTPVLQAVGSAVTDNTSLGGLFWHSSFVRYAEGNAKVYIDSDKPQYLGSVMNAAVRSGGTVGRLDGIGVAALIQANGA